MLPIRDGDLIVRRLTRDDIDEYASWPQYPRPYEPFNETFSLRFAAMDAQARDRWFEERTADASRIMLAADYANESAIANLTLREIDWTAGAIGNMGYLVKPTHVDRGVGTRIMRAVADWCFEHGVVSMRLDVVACNTRAVRCYEKAGFAISGEFWKEEEPLRGKDISLPEYRFMRPHVRVEDGIPQIRFWWMELARSTASC